MPSTSAQTQSTESETPNVPIDIDSPLHESSGKIDNREHLSNGKGANTDISGRPEPEANIDVIETAQQFNQDLLSALRHSKAPEHEEKLKVFTDRAEDWVKHPVSFNRVINFLLDEKLHPLRIIRIYKGQHELGSPQTVFVPSWQDSIGFGSILTKMINHTDSNFSEAFMRLLMGGGRDRSFLITISPDTHEDAKLMNDILLLILELHEKHLKGVNSYCLKHSKYLKKHEASYIPLLCKISKMEEKQNRL